MLHQTSLSSDLLPIGPALFTPLGPFNACLVPRNITSAVGVFVLIQLYKHQQYKHQQFNA